MGSSAPSERLALIKVTPEQLAEKALVEAVQNAMQHDLPVFMDKMFQGKRPDVDDAKGAIFGLSLISDRNAEATNRRFERFERHTWVWRLFHRLPKKSSTSAKA
jgi:hypothetical protein